MRFFLLMAVNKWSTIVHQVRRVFDKWYSAKDFFQRFFTLVEKERFVGVAFISYVKDAKTNPSVFHMIRQGRIIGVTHHIMNVTKREITRVVSIGLTPRGTKNLRSIVEDGNKIHW